MDDPLLHCLAFIKKRAGDPLSLEALRNTVPLTDNKMRPGEFIQAAEKLDLSAQLLTRSLESIPPIILPAVLILKDRGACILLEKKGAEATIIFPETEEGTETIALDQLENEYAGYAIFIKSKYHFDERSDEKHLFSSSESWFWDTFWQFKSLYSKVIAASIFINLFVLAIPMFIMNVYDRVVPNKAVETLWVLTIGVIIVLAFDFLLKILRAYFIDSAGKKADVIISSTLLERTLNSVMEAQPSSVGVRANHMKEFEFVREFFSSATVATMVDLPFVFLFVAVIYFIGGPLCIIPLIGGTLVVTVAAIVSVPLYKAVQQSYVGGAQKTAVMVESLTAIEEIKSASAQTSILGKWQRYASLTAEYLLKARFLTNFALTFTAFTNFLVTITTVVWGVYRIKSGDLTIGGLIACVILTGRAMVPLSQIVSLLTRYQQAKCSLQELNEVMKAPVERHADHHYVSHETFKGAIEFNKVCFSYQEQQTDFFHELSFKMRPGERIAILGNLGSGKSTLLKLVNGLYQPSSGNILIDDMETHQLDPIDVRRSIGYLSQTPRLLFGTARSNITLKASWKDDEEMIKAANLAGASAFINHHPDGFEMRIGEGGKGLSGGQIQTVALARALFLDPPILLLDEPTASMDNATESHFIEQMKTYMKGRSVLLVTHKNAPLQLVDRIIIMQNGAIALDGPRDEVLKKLMEKPKEVKTGG